MKRKFKLLRKQMKSTTFFNSRDSMFPHSEVYVTKKFPYSEVNVTKNQQAGSTH